MRGWRAEQKKIGIHDYAHVARSISISAQTHYGFFCQGAQSDGFGAMHRVISDTFAVFEEVSVSVFIEHKKVDGDAAKKIGDITLSTGQL